MSIVRHRKKSVEKSLYLICALSALQYFLLNEQKLVLTEVFVWMHSTYCATRLIKMAAGRCFEQLSHCIAE